MSGFSEPEIEQALVSCLMQWPDTVFPIVEQFKIVNEHFQTPANRVLFDAVNHFYREGKPLDLIGFTKELRDLSLLEGIGGAHYVTKVWDTCFSPTSAEYYCSLLQESHAKRLLFVTGGELQTEANAPGAEPQEILPAAIQRLSEIPLGANGRKERTLFEMMQDKVERMQRGEEAEDIIKTGIIALDEGSPLRLGDMSLIVGERKAGKTILASTIAINAARNGVPVLYFSLEDPEASVLDKLFASFSRIPMNEQHVSRLTDPDKAAKAAAQFSALPLHIKDSAYDLADIIAITRELKARTKIGLVIIDYAQLVNAPPTKENNRQQEVAEVSRKLRLLAMELKLPMLVLSQLNQEGFTRESKALEQDCTACWKIDILREKQNDEWVPVEGQRWLSVPYQRHGRSGIRFKVTFLGAIARVENYVEEQEI